MHQSSVDIIISLVNVGHRPFPMQPALSSLWRLGTWRPPRSSYGVTSPCTPQHSLTTWLTAIFVKPVCRQEVTKYTINLDTFHLTILPSIPPTMLDVPIGTWRLLHNYFGPTCQCIHQPSLMTITMQSSQKQGWILEVQWSGVSFLRMRLSDKIPHLTF